MHEEGWMGWKKDLIAILVAELHASTSSQLWTQPRTYLKLNVDNQLKLKTFDCVIPLDIAMFNSCI